MKRLLLRRSAIETVRVIRRVWIDEANRTVGVRQDGNVRPVQQICRRLDGVIGRLPGQLICQQSIAHVGHNGKRERLAYPHKTCDDTVLARPLIPRSQGLASFESSRVFPPRGKGGEAEPRKGEKSRKSLATPAPAGSPNSWYTRPKGHVSFTRPKPVRG